MLLAMCPPLPLPATVESKSAEVGYDVEVPFRKAEIPEDQSVIAPLGHLRTCVNYGRHTLSLNIHGLIESTVERTNSHSKLDGWDASYRLSLPELTSNIINIEAKIGYVYSVGWGGKEVLYDAPRVMAGIQLSKQSSLNWLLDYEAFIPTQNNSVNIDTQKIKMTSGTHSLLQGEVSASFDPQFQPFFGSGVHIFQPARIEDSMGQTYRIAQKPVGFISAGTRAQIFPKVTLAVSWTHSFRKPQASTWQLLTGQRLFAMYDGFTVGAKVHFEEAQVEAPKNEK